WSRPALRVDHREQPRQPWHHEGAESRARACRASWFSPHKPRELGVRMEPSKKLFASANETRLRRRDGALRNLSDLAQIVAAHVMKHVCPRLRLFDLVEVCEDAS